MLTISNQGDTKIQYAKTYVDKVFEKVKQRNPHEEEFHQAVAEIFTSLIPLLAKEPSYIEQNILNES